MFTDDGGCLRIKSHRSCLRGKFLDVNRDYVNEIKENGFRLSGIGKQKVYKINISNDKNDFKNSSDIVLFHAHRTGTKSAARSAATVLKPDGYAITLQNGTGNIETLSEVLGAKRVVGGVSYHSAALEGLGQVNHTTG
mgnify:CR=1 FL=1